MNQLNPRGTNVVIDDELAAQQKAVADAKAAQVKARKAALTAAFKESVTEPVVDETTGEVTSEGGTQYVNVERIGRTVEFPVRHEDGMMFAVKILPIEGNADRETTVHNSWLIDGILNFMDSQHAGPHPKYQMVARDFICTLTMDEIAEIEYQESVGVVRWHCPYAIRGIERLKTADVIGILNVNRGMLEVGKVETVYEFAFNQPNNVKHTQRNDRLVRANNMLLKGNKISCFPIEAHEWSDDGNLGQTAAEKINNQLVWRLGTLRSDHDEALRRVKEGITKKLVRTTYAKQIDEDKQTIAAGGTPEFKKATIKLIAGTEVTEVDPSALLDKHVKFFAYEKGPKQQDTERVNALDLRVAVSQGWVAEIQ